MRKTHNPPGILPVVGPFNWGLEVSPAARWLIVSGQVGADASGHVPPGLLDQARLVWSNIDAVLQSAGMSSAPASTSRRRSPSPNPSARPSTSCAPPTSASPRRPRR
jgi:hypothetical protein